MSKDAARSKQIHFPSFLGIVQEYARAAMEGHHPGQHQVVVNILAAQQPAPLR